MAATTKTQWHWAWLASSGAVLEVLASKGGTWTILVTQPNGTSCVVATGEAWQGLTPASAIGPSA
tara:strand:+ start:176 stop:370 length:195 start_codon:yes stop_codon:yes gene_type:complete